MELKSLTPIAEFVDAVYTRAATELPRINGLRWWVELQPPRHNESTTGYIVLKGMVAHSVISTICTFDAIQQGHGMGIEEMTAVADYHIANFKTQAEAHVA
jgi:hypothetical protein